MALLVDPAIRERVDRLELNFNQYGVDGYGTAKRDLARFYTVLCWLYRNYFDVRVTGVDHVPQRGRAMLVGNHSGGVALDGAMILASLFLELEPPRLAHGMADKFINRLPFASQWSNRLGHLTGLPEHAVRLLADERLLMVFPEGSRGTAKLYRERNSLVRFGTGFMRLALQTGSPIVPVAFVGGGDAIPTVANLYRIGRLFGVPYIPVTPYLLPIPRPASLQIIYGEPMAFRGDGNEADSVVLDYVEQVKSRIAELIAAAVHIRHGRREAVG